MQRTNIYLDEELCRALDRIARRRGMSRAALIRELIGQALAGPVEDLQGDLAAIDASFGVVSGEEFRLIRGPDERARHHEEVAGT